MIDDDDDLDFDWNAVSVVQERHELELVGIYANEDGDVVIRQRGFGCYAADSCIVIGRANAQATVDAILETAGLVEREVPKDRTAAERMRRFRNKHRNAVTLVTTCNSGGTI